VGSALQEQPTAQVVTLAAPLAVTVQGSLYDFAGMAALTGTCSSPSGEGRWPSLHMGGGAPTACANYALFWVLKKVRSSPATRSGSPVLSGARCPTPGSSTRRTRGRVVSRASSVPLR
jgi:hypothetical protein